MYVQITSRCNMSCDHCCFNCTSRGHDMSLKDFKAALEIASTMEDTIVIGGGEPTLHPLLPQFVQMAIWELTDVAQSFGAPGVHIVTNGSNEGVALTLAGLARQGVISAALSQDMYHDYDMVSDRVREAFKRPPRNHYGNDRDDKDYRHINGDPHRLVKSGRAGRGECACPEIFIDPHGNIYPCGCKKGKIGHVQDSVEACASWSAYKEGYCAVYQKKELEESLREAA